MRHTETKYIPEATASDASIALIQLDASIDEAVQLMRVNLRGTASVEAKECFEGFCEFIGLDLNEGNK